MGSYPDELNSVQQQAVMCKDGPIMVIAGAGSGKTRVLTYRIAQLIKTQVNPFSILALTFTNKAAREMKIGRASWGKSGWFKLLVVLMLKMFG